AAHPGRRVASHAAADHVVSANPGRIAQAIAEGEGTSPGGSVLAIAGPSPPGPVPLQIDESKLFPPEPTPVGRRPPSQRPRTKAPDRLAIAAVAAAAALGAVFAPGGPAGWSGADAVFRAAFAGLLTFAGSRARRSTWLWASGVATVAAPD